MRRVLDQAYVLHTMPYRESSLIARLLSAQYGIVSVVVRGVYQQNRKAQQLRASLQLGSLLEWQWQGEGSLKNVVQCDLVAHAAIKDSRQLVCLSYINELLLHFLPAEQSCVTIYAAYCQLLVAIANHDDVEATLRQYEHLLFEEMGCAIDLIWDPVTDQPVEMRKQYCVSPEQGLLPYDGSQQGLILTGRELLLLSEMDFTSLETRRLAKRLHRLIIDHHLAGRTLRARALYRQL